MGAFFLSVTKYELNILLRALVHLGNDFVFSNHDHKTVIVLISLIYYVCFGEMMSWHFTIVSLFNLYKLSHSFDPTFT